MIDTSAPHILAGEAAPSQGTRSLYDPAKEARRSPWLRTPIRRREAVLVGINNYVDASVAPLRYCVNDTRAMQALLERLGYIVHALHDGAHTADRKPTRANVAGMLDAVCDRLGPDDMLLVQFSCHGMLVDDRCVLVMQDTWRNRLTHDGLPLSQVRDAMMASKARQQVLLLDACHSGIDLAKAPLAETEAAAAAFSRRVYELAEGFALLSSSTAAQVSQEWQEKKQGLFTYFVIQGLNGRAARSDASWVTVDDIKQYVQRELLRWNEQNPNRPVQQPTAQTEGTGDIILADLSSLSTTVSVMAVASSPPLSLPPLSSPDMDASASQPGTSSPSAVAELAVVCGCNRDKQWNSWQRLAQSRESRLFLLPGLKGEAHELFVRRLVAERKKALAKAPPPLVLDVSWTRRQFPPAEQKDYREALAKALRAHSDAESDLLEQLRQKRQNYQLVLIHPLLGRGHFDTGLIEYYRDILPGLLKKSDGPKAFGVKLVQPIEWTKAAWLLRLLAPIVAVLWPQTPDTCRRALSLHQARRLIKELAAHWSGNLHLCILPELERISEKDIREFLTSLDIAHDIQQRLVDDLYPLDRESGTLLRELILRLPDYQELMHARG